MLGGLGRQDGRCRIASELAVHTTIQDAPHLSAQSASSDFQSHALPGL